MLKEGSGSSAATRGTLLLLVGRGPKCRPVLVGRLGWVNPAAGARLGLRRELSVVLKRRLLGSGLLGGGRELSVFWELFLGRGDGAGGGGGRRGGRGSPQRG